MIFALVLCACILQALAYSLLRDWLLAVDPNVWHAIIYFHSAQRGCESVAKTLNCQSLR